MYYVVTLFTQRVQYTRQVRAGSFADPLAAFLVQHPFILQPLLGGPVEQPAVCFAGADQ